MSWLTRLYVIFGVLALLIIGVSVVTPGWILMEISSQKDNRLPEQNRSIASRMYPSDKDKSPSPKVGIDINLFYAVVCVAGVCLSKSMDESFVGPGTPSALKGVGFESWTQYRIEGIIAIGFCSIGTIMTLVYAREHKGGNRVSGIIAAVCMGIAGLVSLLLLGQFIRFTTELHDVSRELLRSSVYIVDIGIPYSVIISGLGCTSAMVTVVLLTVALKRQQIHAGSGTSGQIISGSDTPGQIIQYPSETNQNEGKTSTDISGTQDWK